MIEKTVVLKNRLGLHARAAAKLVHTAAHYSRPDHALEGR